MQSYLTGWFALTRRTTTAPGQRLLVLGAGGGVGLAAVDIGPPSGLEVYAAASSAEKLAAGPRTAGAVALIDSSTEDVKERAKELVRRWRRRRSTTPSAASSAQTCLRALGDEGTYVVIGFVGRHPPAARQPDPAAQPAGGRRRLGRLGRAPPGARTRR